MSRSGYEIAINVLLELIYICKFLNSKNFFIVHLNDAKPQGTINLGMSVSYLRSQFETSTK